MQKRRFVGRGPRIPRMAFSVRPGVRFDRNSGSIGPVMLMIVWRSVPVILIAPTSHRAASERPACDMLEFAPLVAVHIVDATERVELLDSR